MVLLVPALLTGRGSQLWVEQQAWCAFHGEEVRVFRAAMDEAWGNGPGYGGVDGGEDAQ